MAKMEKKNMMKGMKTGVKYLVVVAIGVGAGGFLGYEYGNTESSSKPASQGLERQISSLEKEVNKLKATITGLEEEAVNKSTDVGALTYPNELPTANVSPEPLETGKAMKIAPAVTPSTHTTTRAPTIHDVAAPAPQADHITAMDTMNKLNTPSVSEANNYQSAMHAEIASQSAAPSTSSTGQYRIQVSSFQYQRDAQAMQAKLQGLGISSKLAQAQVNGRTWHRVQVGPYTSMTEARSAKSNLQSSIKGSMLIVKSSR
ncbi:MAG: SPOR domain-containing protein [Mariprofundaceae bacterium]|nr:SPOR domain-containing protein [Mariprofundaceae bacterium]